MSALEKGGRRSAVDKPSISTASCSLSSLVRFLLTKKVTTTAKASSKRKKAAATPNRQRSPKKRKVTSSDSPKRRMRVRAALDAWKQDRHLTKKLFGKSFVPLPYPRDDDRCPEPVIERRRASRPKTPPRAVAGFQLSESPPKDDSVVRVLFRDEDEE